MKRKNSDPTNNRDRSYQGTLIGGAAAILAVSFFLGLNANKREAGTTTTTSTAPANPTMKEIDEVANNPKLISELSKSALSQFEKQVKGKGANIWLFAGVCSLMEVKYPHEPNNAVIADIVTDPGVIHIKVPNEDVTFTEAVEWDTTLNQYELGQVDLYGSKAPGDKALPSVNKQFNLNYYANLRMATVQYSQSENEVFSIGNGQHIPVMNSIGTVVSRMGGSLQELATAPSVHSTCESKLYDNHQPTANTA